MHMLAILQEKRKLEAIILAACKVFEEKSDTIITTVLLESEIHSGHGHKIMTNAVFVRSEDKRCVYKGGA